MAVKVPIRTVFDGSTATGLAEYQSGEFIGLTHGGIGASLSIGSAGQVLKVNSAGNALEFGTGAVAAAQTTITSILATDLIIGEDTQTAIDFGTANEIDFKVDNAARLTLTSSVLFPVTDNQIDLGTSSLEFKDAFFDGTVTSDAFAGPLTGNVTGTASIATNVTVADESSDTTCFPTFVTAATGNLPSKSGSNLTFNSSSGLLTATLFAGDLTGDVTGNADTATLATTVVITDNESTNENNAIIFTAGGDLDGGNLGLESDGDLKYNPSTGTLSATNISVSGTFSTVNSVTMDANNAVIFEGSTADAHETTLTSIDATGDRTISLPNVSGTLPVLAAASATAISSTPEELNILDGATVVVGEINALDLGSTAVGTAIASKAVILDSNLDYTGIRNLTITGEIDAATGDYSGAVDVAGALTTVAITTTGVVDITDATDSSNDTGDTGALRTEGGASIAKKLFVGSAVDFSTTLQVDGVATFTGRDIHSGGITVANAGQIGSVGDADAIAISSGGDVTLTQDLILSDASSVNISTPLLAGTDHTFTGLSAQMLAGGAIAAFKLVCIHTTTSEVVTADASAFATARTIGIAPAAISDTATGTILLQGFIRDDTFNFTTGATLYLSETAGALTETAPTTDGAFVNVVGVALSPDVVYINPSLDVIEHA